MRWSVVVPVYNEAAFLPDTLIALSRQERPFALILVDNGSTDDGVARARAIVAERGMSATFIREPEAGQVHALRRGIAEARTEFVSICDADTVYPPHYLGLAERLFDRLGPECVATAACLRKGMDPARLDMNSVRQLIAARIMPRQNHTSGAAHCFRLEALRRAGGYDAAIWPYVIKDHELMHRVLKLGRIAWHRDLWCVSSDRRRRRAGVRWTLLERLAYHLTPFGRKDRFFHGWLAPRFEARGQRDIVLRQRGWEQRQGTMEA